MKAEKFRAYVSMGKRFLYYKDEEDCLLSQKKIPANKLPDIEKMEYLETWNYYPGIVKIYRHKDKSLWGFVTGTGEGLYGHRVKAI